MSNATLWGGRFEKGADDKAFAFNASISFDYRLAKQDVRGSLAWCRSLVKTGVLTEDEGQDIEGGLLQILEEYERDDFEFLPGDEDIHTAVERRLVDLIGPLAGKLHTGRSRNDQVATDFRLWLLDHIPYIDSEIKKLQLTLINRAEEDFMHPMPGYTHLQPAQPLLLGHWWLSFFWPLQRDRDRLKGVLERSNLLPLGCGALAGTPFSIDREFLSEELGFRKPFPNSIDAVSDRDFAVEFLFFASMVGIHLSRLSENIVIFTSKEFGFFELDDAYSTGSSLMPQKKNPDHFELVRGKSGTIIGHLTGLLTTLKGLPSTYDKDLQEDKPPVFSATDILFSVLPVLAGAISTLRVNPKRMLGSIDEQMLATDLADYLVGKGVPFRKAHEAVGKVVQIADTSGARIREIPLSKLKNVHQSFDADFVDVFNVEHSIAKRNAIGGTAPDAVKYQLEEAKNVVNS